jgi:glycosyltransferase involved in cell wall biosynthesis
LEWFDHIFRGFSSADYRTTCITSRLFCTGAALYIPFEILTRVGYFDEAFKMGFEDVDYCIRAWDCKAPVIYAGVADIRHHESMTRGLELGERERISKEYFWIKHKDRFGRRLVHNGDGIINVVFVLQDTGVGGGHRVVFMFANELARYGFRVSIFSLASSPSWFELDSSIEFRSFPDYNELSISLAPLNAIKVATWWETAQPVWDSSIKYGLPVWLSQDIESSYYNDFAQKINVLSSYKPEFVYIVNYKWIQHMYQAKFFYHSHYVGLGVASQTFYPEPEVLREKKTILFCARSEPLKGFTLTRECIPVLLSAGYKLIAFGSEPDLVSEWPEVEFHFKPADVELRRLYSRAEIFLQTSVHEGFSLPPLEAMACGAISVMTDATGNMDFARHMQNTIIIDRSADSLMNALRRLSIDHNLRRMVADESQKTVLDYQWEKPLSRLIRLFTAISESPVYGKQFYEY